jgi:hypothetical protein
MSDVNEGYVFECFRDVVEDNIEQSRLRFLC